MIIYAHFDKNYHKIEIFFCINFFFFEILFLKFFFEFQSLGIGLPHTSLNNPSRTAGNISPFERSFEETHVQKSSTKLKDLITGFSPSATASYFNQNFDENGYVFDGVKIEVIFFLFSHYSLLK